MQYIEVTLVVRWPVEDLALYEALTIEEAAANQAQWCRDGEASIGELIEFAEEIRREFRGVDANTERALDNADDVSAAAANAYSDALLWYGPNCHMSALRAAIGAALQMTQNRDVRKV